MKLSVRSLTLKRAGRLLVHDLNFDIEPGQLWCVLGRNACGKTTLLHTLAGLHRPTHGQIRLGEKELGAWDWRELAQVRALLGQKSEDIFSATVMETVLAARAPHRQQNWPWQWSWDDAQDQMIAQQALQALDLLELQIRNILTLSGGERQRVAMATLLAQTPWLALLDEPTAHLDLDVQHQVLGLLAHHVLHQKNPASAIVALHDVNLAQRYATHVLLFYGDGLVLSGSKAALLTADHLSHVYRHPVHMITAQQQRWFFVE